MAKISGPGAFCASKNPQLCSYRIVEEGETLDNSTQLVRFKGKWLVDIHDDLDDFIDE